MKFFFDHCVCYRYAHSIRPLTKWDGNDAFALIDLLSPDATDEEWMTYLAQSGDLWGVITQDLGDPAHPAKISELVSQKIIVFILHRTWMRHNFWLQAYRLVQWWPQIQMDAKKANPGTVHDVPFRFTSGRSLIRR